MTLPTNAVRNYITDEFGNQSQILGDNIYKGAILSIPVEHHEIHCGDSFESTYTGDLANAASIVFSIIVPNEGLVEAMPGDNQTKKQYHVKINIDTEAEALITIHEGATLSANGTAIPIINRNRNFQLPTTLTFNHTPTVTGAGTQIYQRRIGSGKTVGGSAGRENEIILKDNTKYTITILNATVSDNYYNIELDYYIHPGV